MTSRSSLASHSLASGSPLFHRSPVLSHSSDVAIPDDSTVARLELELSRQSSEHRQTAKDYRRRLRSMSSDLKAARSETRALLLEKDRLAAQVQSAQQESQVLKLQLEAAHASHIESESAWTSAQTHSRQLSTALNSLSAQTESQAQEIAVYSGERAELLALVHKLHSALCSSESVLAEVVGENRRLKSKREIVALPNREQIVIPNPFKGELGSRVDVIVKARELSENQKIEMVVKEAAEAIEESEKQKEEMVIEFEKKLQTEAKMHKKTVDGGRAIVASLRQLALHEAKIDTKLFCSADVAFRELMSMRAFEYRIFENSTDSRYLPFNLFGQENQKNRLEVMDQIEELGADASAFMSALFAVNTHLSKQVSELLDASAEKSALDEVLSSLGLTDPKEIPEAVERIRSRFAQIRSEKKELQEAVRVLQADLTNSQVSQEALSRKLTESQVQVRSLRATVEDLSTHVSELEAIDAEPKPDPSPIDSSLQVSELDSQIAELKQALTEKESELNRALDRQNESELVTSSELQRMNLMNDSLATKLQVVRNAYQQLKQKEGKSQLNQEKALARAKKEYRASLKQLEHEFESAKKQWDQSNAELQQRVAELMALTKKLSSSLEESEKRNQMLTGQLSKLAIDNHSLETQNAAIEDRLARARQSFQMEDTARTLALETKFLQAQNEERAKLSAQTHAVLGLVADELGPLYGFSGLDLDLQSCRQLLQRVKTDMRRLLPSV